MTTMRSLIFFFFTSFALYGSLVVESGVPENFYDWFVSYGSASPFGIKKKVILINNQFPGPLINTTTNNIVHVNVHNDLDEPFLLTWNGVQMRRNSWNDGTQGTTCPIQPGKNWTYNFQVKDQIGSYSYFPSLLLHRAAGGYGPIRINNREVIPVPFDSPYEDYDILIGDWYNADHKAMGDDLDKGKMLPSPDGVLINGKPPFESNFHFKTGKTYRLRISNVGLKTSLNFKIERHRMLLVETEGSYTLKTHYYSLDVHVGQSYSVLFVASNPRKYSYNMMACSRYVSPVRCGVANVHYPGSVRQSPHNLAPPEGPRPKDYNNSMNQARSIRWDLDVGAARPNPQGSYRYGNIDVSRTIVLQNGVGSIDGRTRFTVNNVSFLHSDTPLKLADHFKISNIFFPGLVPDRPGSNKLTLSTPVMDARYKDFVQIVFQNDEPNIQTWHIDGYNFFVTGMGFGVWDGKKKSTYNLVDAVSRSTVQVYPKAWTAILLSLDNEGMWNIRSQDEEKRYLGQEVYMRVRGYDGKKIPDPCDEMPIPSDLPLCGRAKRNRVSGEAFPTLGQNSL